MFAQGPAHPSDSPGTGSLVGVRTFTEKHEVEPVIVKHLETQLKLIRKKSTPKICRKIGKESSIVVFPGMSLSFPQRLKD